MTPTPTQRTRGLARTLVLAALLLLLLADAMPAHAYIGPGAGFAVAGSLFAFFAAIASAFLTFLTWPVRLLKRVLFGWRVRRKARFRRIVILGLDGMDHGLTETMLEAGKLPNFAAYANPTVYQTYGAGRMPPWILYNATVKYDIGTDASVALTVNNLFNAMPPLDRSFTFWPYYDYGAYNIYGRSYYVDFNYRF